MNLSADDDVNFTGGTATFDGLVAQTVTAGLGGTINADVDLVKTVEVPSDRFVRDIDTAADYRAATS